MERGSDITDHDRNMPITLELEGIVSDRPFGTLRTDREFDGHKGSLLAFERLTEIRDDKEPVIIETSLDTYPNMMMMSLTVPRDAGTGESFRFSASFKQVTFIDNERTLIEVADERAKKIVKRGHKASQDPADGKVAAPSESTKTGSSALVKGLRWAAKKVTGN